MPAANKSKFHGKVDKDKVANKHSSNLSILITNTDDSKQWKQWKLGKSKVSTTGMSLVSTSNPGSYFSCI